MLNCHVVLLRNAMLLEFVLSVRVSIYPAICQKCDLYQNGGYHVRSVSLVLFSVVSVYGCVGRWVCLSVCFCVCQRDES